MKTSMPRYAKEFLKGFVEGISRISESSKIKTTTELAIESIELSIKHDVTPFTRQSQDGNDVKSIAYNRIAALRPLAQAEAEAQEIECIKGIEELIKTLQIDLEERRSELEKTTKGGYAPYLLTMGKARRKVESKDQDQLRRAG